ncbi:MAG: 7-cyano-7-deazaguanine synthase QueC [Hyphomicrobiales bacterium]|nr:7-cyano-7-deazaguanine synthase QueC [Hyphomicrobiales bacterium]
MKPIDDAALVLFSGGQDSTVCLAWALTRYARVETVGFSYGQRHGVELECRADILRRLPVEFPQWAGRLGEDHLIDIAALGAISDTALTRDAEITFGANGLPTTFVPGRNILFLTFAAALGYRRGILRLVGGMCETDYSGYPDCRNETLRSLEETLRLATEARFQLELPLMWRSKADTWALADALGGAALVDLVVEATHTCYHGDRTRRHDWGYGCSQCPACTLRAAGWKEWREQSSTRSG